MRRSHARLREKLQQEELRIFREGGKPSELRAARKAHTAMEQAECGSSSGGAYKALTRADANIVEGATKSEARGTFPNVFNT